jgi:GT2 family glycosyltransferase
MSVVLVCWNNRDYLEPCLRSLYRAELRASFDVVVVDNGSTDGSQDMLRTTFPGVCLIENGHNVGLGRASNQGIEATRGRHVLLLNNDTLVNGPSLDAFVDFMDVTPDAAAVGGKLLHADGSLQAGYASFPTLWQELMFVTRLGEWLHPGYPSHGDSTQPKVVGWLSSACLLLRRLALDEVGLLDEEYFIYSDEVDLQYRLARAGWRVYFLPSATTLHYGGRSTDRWRRRRMVYRGRLLFFAKHYGRFRAVLLRALFAAAASARFCFWVLAYVGPAWRCRARAEARSNTDILKLCVHLT